MVREGCRCFAGLSRLRRYRSAPKDVDIRIAESVDTSTSVSKTVDPIVRASSVLSNFVAPPWQLVDLYEGYAPVPTWEDPQGRPELTAKQNTRLSHWIRLFENNDKIKLFNAVPSSSRIRQGFVADCSFLAALAALADYEYRYGVPLLTNIIDFVSVSKDGYAGVLAAEPAEEPRSEPGERQCAIGVKLYFNGSARCVLVDDWIPVRADGRMLCAHSDNPNECWVTILEKAFVKLNGGRYTIGGTNPGVDIYHLTGWIPEILTLPATACSPPDSAGSSGSAKVKWEQVWDVMYAGFSSGSCVVCLGTGEIADAVPYGDGNTEGISRSSGIVSDHAYSVLDIKDVLLRGKHRARLLYLKNPWGSVSWIRRFSPSDTKSWTTELQKTLRYVPDRNRDTGKFWIEWSDVLRWFSHLYISWKPSVFGNRVTVHDVWRHDKRFCHSLVPEDMYMSVFNPQFTLTVNFGGQNSAVVWLLLLQHRQNGEDALKYLTMHVFSRDDAVICPPLPDVQGVYNNGECILVKLLVKNEARGEPPAKHMLTGETVVAYNNGRDNTLLVLLSYYNQKVQHAADPADAEALPGEAALEEDGDVRRVDRAELRRQPQQPVELLPQPALPAALRRGGGGGGAAGVQQRHLREPAHLPGAPGDLPRAEGGPPGDLGRVQDPLLLDLPQLPRGAVRADPLRVPPGRLRLLPDRRLLQEPLLDCAAALPALRGLGRDGPPQPARGHQRAAAHGGEHADAGLGQRGGAARRHERLLRDLRGLLGGGAPDAQGALLLLRGQRRVLLPQHGVRHVRRAERALPQDRAQRPSRRLRRRLRPGGVQRPERRQLEDGARLLRVRAPALPEPARGQLHAGRAAAGAAALPADGRRRGDAGHGDPHAVVAVGHHERGRGLGAGAGACGGLGFVARRAGGGLHEAEVVAENGAEGAENVDLVRVNGRAHGVHDGGHDAHAADGANHGLDVAREPEDAELGELDVDLARVVEPQVQLLDLPSVEVDAQLAGCRVGSDEHEPEQRLDGVVAGEALLEGHEVLHEQQHVGLVAHGGVGVDQRAVPGALCDEVAVGDGAGEDLGQGLVVDVVLVEAEVGVQRDHAHRRQHEVPAAGLVVLGGEVVEDLQHLADVLLRLLPHQRERLHRVCVDLAVLGEDRDGFDDVEAALALLDLGEDGDDAGGVAEAVPLRGVEQAHAGLQRGQLQVHVQHLEVLAELVDLHAGHPLAKHLGVRRPRGLVQPGHPVEEQVHHLAALERRAGLGQLPVVLLEQLRDGGLRVAGLAHEGRAPLHGRRLRGVGGAGFALGGRVLRKVLAAESVKDLLRELVHEELQDVQHLAAVEPGEAGDELRQPEQPDGDGHALAVPLEGLGARRGLRDGLELVQQRQHAPNEQPVALRANRDRRQVADDGRLVQGQSGVAVGGPPLGDAGVVDALVVVLGPRHPVLGDHGLQLDGVQHQLAGHLVLRSGRALGHLERGLAVDGVGHEPNDVRLERLAARAGNEVEVHGDDALEHVEHVDGDGQVLLDALNHYDQAVLGDEVALVEDRLVELVRLVEDDGGDQRQLVGLPGDGGELGQGPLEVLQIEDASQLGVLGNGVAVGHHRAHGGEQKGPPREHVVPDGGHVALGGQALAPLADERRRLRHLAPVDAAHHVSKVLHALLHLDEALMQPERHAVGLAEPPGKEEPRVYLARALHHERRRDFVVGLPQREDGGLQLLVDLVDGALRVVEGEDARHVLQPVLRQDLLPILEGVARLHEELVVPGNEGDVPEEVPLAQLLAGLHPAVVPDLGLVEAGDGLGGLTGEGQGAHYGVELALRLLPLGVLEEADGQARFLGDDPRATLVEVGEHGCHAGDVERLREELLFQLVQHFVPRAERHRDVLEDLGRHVHRWVAPDGALHNGFAGETAAEQVLFAAQEATDGVSHLVLLEGGEGVVELREDGSPHL
ncbi:calpain family cysteine protease domain-containing protein [Babesia caballi]|uniref:Calpain family cysteine protease domain-containing protein n=1 Tax=Babesia caballi TaxID=5871 RepID=A0AAV4LNP9_BABCB|nr:calpain family cysteine protease domain-containing protein [Babesia caballi]